MFCTFWLGNVLRATTACTFSTSQLPKVVRTPSVLYILTWKCASRHNGVHFFDIATSKSGPKLRCFVHFDLEMCFAPQRRALFQHLNFQKWSEAEVFCTFWLGNVLRATTAFTFLTSQLPKVVRDRQFLTLLTSKCASRHNGVQFFIAPVASWLRTRRFSEPTFRPSGATNHSPRIQSMDYLHAFGYARSQSVRPCYLRSDHDFCMHFRQFIFRLISDKFRQSMGNSRWPCHGLSRSVTAFSDNAQDLSIVFCLLSRFVTQHVRQFEANMNLFR